MFKRFAAPLRWQVLEKDPKPMTIEVPINSALCVGLQQVDLYKSVPWLDDVGNIVDYANWRLLGGSNMFQLLAILRWDSDG